MRRGMAEALRSARQAGRAVVLITPLDGTAQRLLDGDGLNLLALTDAPLAEAGYEALRTDRAAVMMHASGELLVVPQNPPLRLCIVGAVHISEALSVMALQCGYQVTVIDPRTAFLRPERFPGVRLLGLWPQQAFAELRPDARTAVVLLTHDPKIDDPALLAVLPTSAFYVGALGSARTHAKRLERLAAAGVEDGGRARIHGPAGLAIGARSPEEIAVSVMAQITAVLRGVAA